MLNHVRTYVCNTLSETLSEQRILPYEKHAKNLITYYFTVAADAADLSRGGAGCPG